MSLGKHAGSTSIDEPQEWLATDTLNATTSIISCEPCRHKKRKCDRLLPVCTLCTTSGTQCQYPERGKRGMPIGYITQLEERLAEAETALFRLHAEHELYRAGRQALPVPADAILKAITSNYGSLSKQEKISAWQRHNLNDESGRWQWWQETNQSADLRVDVPIFASLKAETPGNGESLLRHLSSATTSPNDHNHNHNHDTSIAELLNRIPAEERPKYF